MADTVIYLASASPRRRDLLRQVGIPFRTIPTTVEEEEEVSGPPEEVTTELARRKAERASRQLASDTGRGATGGSGTPATGERLVIAADTVVILDGRTLGKPRDGAEARSMLAMLSGRVHRVITGVAVGQVETRLMRVEHEETRVWVRKLNPAEIDAYVATGEPMDKAGAYGIQGKGSILVEHIEGCYHNVVGLPLARLTSMLREFGVDVVSFWAR